MTKAEITKKIMDEVNCSSTDAAAYIETVLDEIKVALQQGENVKISGFGSFKVNDKSERLGRNPVTGEPLTIESRRVVTFKPSLMLKERINSEG